MNIRKGPAILAVLTTLAVVVGIVLLSGGEDSEAPTSGPDETASQQAAAGGGGKGGTEKSGGQGSGADKGSGGSGSGDSGSGGGGSGGSGVPVIEVAGGEPVGGVEELEFRSGEEIRFAVASDTADEIHFHGYDLYADIPAGGEGEIETKAEIEGVFEVELHDLGIQVAEVTVSP